LIFKIDELPAERFAESLGLPGAPKIKFLTKEAAKKRKNASRLVEAAEIEATDGKKAPKSRVNQLVEGDQAEGEEGSEEVSSEASESGASSEEGEEEEQLVAESTTPGKAKQVRAYCTNPRCN
jgi:ATP-dependent RNA helicase DDX10/DBP4